MNKLNFLLVAILLVIAKTGQGQSKNVTNAWNYNQFKEYDKAKVAIDEASVHEGTKDEPKTWLYRGDTYKGLATSNKPEFQKLSPDPIGEAISSYAKCIELDTKKRYSDDAANSLREIAIGLSGVALSSFKAKDYEHAITLFEKYQLASSIFSKYVKLNYVDTSTIFYIGYSAYELKNYAKTKEQFNLLVDKYKYDDPFVYCVLSDIYLDEKDTARGYEILDKGMVQAKGKSKSTILISKFNILKKQGKTNEAIELGKSILASEPDNVSA